VSNYYSVPYQGRVLACGRYYGTVDAASLFVFLAAAYFEREIWNFELCLAQHRESARMGRSVQSNSNFRGKKYRQHWYVPSARFSVVRRKARATKPDHFGQKASIGGRLPRRCNATLGITYSWRKLLRLVLSTALVTGILRYLLASSHSDNPVLRTSESANRSRSLLSRCIFQFLFDLRSTGGDLVSLL
jgi:hypothetical protein